MRSFAVAAIVTSAVAAVLTGQPASTVVITGVTVITGDDEPRRVANVVVRDGLIAEIGPPGPARAAGAIVDGRGKFLIPGLWDMHVHLATRPEPLIAEKVMLPLFLTHGIVGVRDMGGPLERVLDLRARAARGDLAGPRILTPGPFVDGPGEASAMFRRLADAPAAAVEVPALAGAGVDFIKVQSGLEPGMHSALARAARAANVPLAGHIPVAMTAEEILASGQRSLEHISPALAEDGLLLFACSTASAELIGELRAIARDRATGPATEIALREAALRQRVVETYDPLRARALGRSMRERQVWIVPTLIFSASLRPLTREHDGTDLPMEVVPVATRTRWLEGRKRYLDRQTEQGFAAAAALAGTAARAVRDLHAGGAKVLAGTDTFDAFVLPGFSLHQELQLLVGAGFSPLHALQAATRNAAEYRGTLKTEGTIRPGKRADLVLLDGDPLIDIANARRVAATIVGGRVYSRDRLDALAAGVKAFGAN
ncbi:MAG TPA: amidohydrolase family protein [Vicinamibacterales bacterium]|nr:amidohydrolase family protein [Vicinamibacterales bacterium]